MRASVGLARALGVCAVFGLSLGGCFLPVSTARPQGATTYGKGGMGVAAYGEFPTIDLVATQSDENITSDEYGLAPLPTETLGVGYGLTDDFDLTAGVDSVFYFVLPLPLGGWIGGRWQLESSPNMDVALTGRTGFVALDDEENIEKLRASYAQIGASVQLWPNQLFQPVANFSVMPAFVQNDKKNEAPESFTTLSANLTLAALISVGPIQVGPFLNVVYFRSPNLAGSTVFPTGGFLIELRSRKHRSPDQIGPPAPPPGPGTAVPTGPPGAPR